MVVHINKMAGRIVAMVAMVCLCFACEQDQLGTYLSDSGNEIVIAGGVEGSYTRATEMSFEDGDQMGVYIVDYDGSSAGALLSSGNRASNVQFTYDAAANTWSGNKTIYWADDETKIDVYGYYPMANSIADVNSYSFTVQSDQNSIVDGGDMGGYEASDLMWAKSGGVAPTTDVIELLYSHKMACVVVSLTEGSGFSDGEWSGLTRSVTIDNIIRGAEVDLATGSVATSGSVDKNITPLMLSSDSYRAVVVPQSVDAGKSLIGITIDGISYNHTKELAMSYTQGMQHSFTISVDKKEHSGDYAFTLVDESIEAWSNDTTLNEGDTEAYYIIHVEEAGTLKACIEAAGLDYETLTHLKVTGYLTTEDFYFMRDEMLDLNSLNLADVTTQNCLCCKLIISGTSSTSFSYYYSDYALPYQAFYENTSLRSLVLPNNLETLSSYSLRSVQLTSDLVIPESVTRIDAYALYDITTDIEVVMPSSLEYIGTCAFAYSEFSCELKLSNSLEYLGTGAFLVTPGFYGALYISPNIVYGGYGSGYFSGMGEDNISNSDNTGITGDIDIPQSMTVIPSSCFMNIGFASGSGKIVLHDAVTAIGSYAFKANHHGSELYLPESIMYIGEWAFGGEWLGDASTISGTLNLPSNLLTIGSYAFFNSLISGTLTIPEKITAISENAFSSTKIEVLELPTNLEIIAAEAFKSNSELKTINFPKYLYYIGENAFNDCPAITSIICEATTPPTLGSDVFAACDMDHLILEVPASSVNLYKNADGWKEFTYITAYHELACSISSITTLNSGTSREGIVQSEGSWSVESAPDWCTVSPTSSTSNKTELFITVNGLTSGSGNREGEIVLKLDAEDYRTTIPVTQYDYTEYAEDSEIVLQSATTGSGINIFVVGDGFSAEEIYDGSYLTTLKESIEYMFDIEPYKTYRDYFNISTSIALSTDSGVNTASAYKELKFNTIDNYGSLSCDYDDLEEYVMNTSSTINSGNLSEALIVVIANVEQFSSDTRLSETNSTISICAISNDSYPYDMRGVIQHEVGGVGFGKLGNESVSHYDFISTCGCSCCNGLSTYNWAKENGWFNNLSMSNKMTEAPWYHLIFDERYSKYVDLYEGGYNHARGVYRSENKSCMNTYIPYYNTISRQSIVERIMEYSGGTFDFETFVENDVMENFED